LWLIVASGSLHFDFPPLFGGLEGSLSARRVIDQPEIATGPFLGLAGAAHLVVWKTAWAMPRPQLPPHLVPRQPKTVLGWSMQKLRLIHGVTGKQVAQEFGCSPAHISRVEQGSSKPSRELVQFYEEQFEADGLLLSLFEVADHASEQERRRTGGRRPRLHRAIPGDASTFLGDTIPHGSLMEPGQVFEQTWRVKNSGTVAWVGRKLERQGPLTGPGLISSLRLVDIPDTKPGKVAVVTAPLKAPTYDCSSIAYFKMVDADGRLCFPDSYQLGLDVLVLVEGQGADKPIET
jgi:transcriptional regulator with XRE-family HTH domain